MKVELINCFDDGLNQLELSANNINVKLSSNIDDTFIKKYSQNSPSISSWGEFDWSTSKDWVSFIPNDELPPYPDIIGSWDDNVSDDKER